jgi:general secretion pathway protein I
MPPLQTQRGFTLIEVVVAFAIFAMCIGAVYETFSAALRRSERSQQRELASLTVQSLLSQQRVQPGPWAAQRSGTTAEGARWRIRIEPYDTGTDLHNPWRAYHVSIEVVPNAHTVGTTQIDSVELARISP